MDRGHGLVDGVRPESSADDDPRRAGLRRIDQLGNRSRDVMRIGGVGGGEHPPECLEHLAWDLADITVVGHARSVCWLLHGGVHISRIGAWLNEHDIYTELQDLVAKAVGE